MAEEIKEKEKLIAVLIADNFNRAFAPIDQEFPVILTPLCGVPIIEYTIELLVRSKVSYLYICCCTHTKQLKEYFQYHRFGDMKVKIMSSTNSTSVGEVLRELDQKKIQLKDFVLLFGDVIGNASIESAIESHKRTRQEDKEYIMTKIFREEKVNSRLRTPEDQNVVVLEGSQILQYDSLEGVKKFSLNSNVKFSGARSFDVRYDLIDTGINICSGEMLHYFVDNFDYMFIQEHLMKDILTSEVYTDKFAAYIMPNNTYLARVKSPRILDAVSKDCMNRWIHPMTPDSYFSRSADSNNFRFSRQLLYKDEGISMGSGSRIEAPSCIGKDCMIGENSLVSNSVIGKDCRIGNDTVIKNSYIWSSVTIGSNTTIVNSIICSNVTVGSNCSIQTGSILSFDCQILDDVSLPKYTRVSMYKNNKNKLVRTEESTEIGKGWIFEPPEEIYRKVLTLEKLETNSIGGTLNWLNCEESDDSNSDSDDEPPDRPDVTTDFVEEVRAIVGEMITSRENVDLIEIELNRLKFHQNESFLNCAYGIVKGLFDTVKARPDDHFQEWSPLLNQYLVSENEKKLIIAFIEQIIPDTPFARQFHVIIAKMYEEELVTEDSIIEWYEESQAEEFKRLMQEFVEWLQEED